MKMKNVDQSHPQTNETFGLPVYGPAPVADGGHEQSDGTMADVEHEPPAEGAVRSFERGPAEESVSNE